MDTNPQELMINLDKNWIATITLQTNLGTEYQPYEKRLDALFLIIDRIAPNLKGDGVIVFPAGWFNTGNDNAPSLLPTIEQIIEKKLSCFPNLIIIVFGIDGNKDEEGNDRDQIAIAISKHELVAAARKFNPTKDDLEFGLVPVDILDKELSKCRIFSLNGIKYFIAVCNDISGGHSKRIDKNSIHFDIILNPVHKFEKGDGITDWVRKKVGLESKYWNCPIFGSVKFINGYGIQEIWRPGIFWPFKETVTILTKNTTVDKITLPWKGDPIHIKDLPNNEMAIVHIFQNFSQTIKQMKERTSINDVLVSD